MISHKSTFVVDYSGWSSKPSGSIILRIESIIVAEQWYECSGKVVFSARNIHDGYCESHARKSGSSSSSSKSSGSTSSSYTRQCIVSGYHNSRVGGSSYCSKHKCGKSGCTNKAGAGGYCDRHREIADDPYDVYEYDDPEDFYYDWADDFWDYEDAEDYWEDAWN